MKIIRQIGISGILAFLIVMSIGMFQVMYNLRNLEHPMYDVEAGFPIHFFYFSIDGNALQGFRLENFLVDFGIFFVVVLICLLGFSRLKGTKKDDLIDTI